MADEVAHRETLARLRAAVDRLPAAERSAVLGAADHRPPRERERLRRRGLEMLRFALGDLTC